MSLASGFTWTHQDIKLVGYSLAGITTTVIFPAADICFDVGQGLPFQVPIRNIAITHGHLDHASGLPYLLGQKAMHNVPAANVYVPEALIEPMQRILEIWSAIEDHTYHYKMEGLTAGEERELKGKYILKPFPTYHRIPSQGYTVYLKKKRLRQDFQNLSSHELRNARQQGLALEEEYLIPTLSFTGDTTIEALNSLDVRSSRVLVLECTYWDSKKSIAHAREWGHIHLDEIIPRLDDLNCERLVLIHSSARYRKEELLRILDERVPAKHRDRVELFPRL